MVLNQLSFSRVLRKSLGLLWNWSGYSSGWKNWCLKKLTDFFPKKFQTIIGPLLLSSSLSVSLSFSTSLLLFLIDFPTLCILLIKALEIAQKQYGEGYHINIIIIIIITIIIIIIITDWFCRLFVYFLRHSTSPRHSTVKAVKSLFPFTSV